MSEPRTSPRDVADSGEPVAVAHAHPTRPTPARTAPSARAADQGSNPRAARPAKGIRLPSVEEVSAGGLVLSVVNGITYAALIGRYDPAGVLRWLIPKGHVEPGESFDATAVREVQEETGIVGDIVATLGTVSYWFTTLDRRVHKTVHHYVLRMTAGDLSDDDREVDSVAWVPLEDVPRWLSYADERRLAVQVTTLLADLT